MVASTQLILATDLDGTFIPLDGNEQNRRDLTTLVDEFRHRNIVLTFVTGRHPESVRNAVTTYNLPEPDWLICDVGTSIFCRGDNDQLLPVSEYTVHLQQIVGDMPVERLRARLSGEQRLRLQEDEKQGRFKLSYYVDRDLLFDAVRSVQDALHDSGAPYSLIDSVDPFTDDGLIDLLPTGVSKAFALDWWTRHTGHHQESIVFAGDSGNDLAAFTSGYRAIIVANTDREVAREAADAHRKAAWQNRLFLANAPATSGVLEGCRHFGLID